MAAQVAGSEPDESDELLGALRRATARAVAESRPVAERLAEDVTALATELLADPPAAPVKDDAQVQELLRIDRVTAEAVADELRGLVAAQLGSIDRFTIVFFGRTLVGKSSTIEALVGGDGATISNGKCDNTTEVRPVDWASCRLYDTPGINGWGRTVSREALEERAEVAVEAADLVVLCFDVFGQQEAEFHKVATWVANYGKPAVALFNVKNPRWRLPPREPAQSSRRQLSRTVAEQVEHIRHKLVEIGLAEVPIVAFHAHRAVAARVADSYAGNDAVTVHKQRARYGTARLWAWSNLGAFEQLIATAIEADAVGIRLGRLFSQVRGALERADRILYEQVQCQAQAAAGPVEDGLRQMMALLGGSAHGPDAKWPDRLGCALRELRDVHGVVVDVPAVGSAQRYANNIIAARTAPLRTEAQRRADEAVDAAMHSRTALSEQQFARAAFDSDRLAQVSREVLAELAGHVDKGLGLVAEDIQADLAFNVKPSAAVDGRAGKLLRRAGYGVGYGGVGVGAVAILIGFSPVGWALGTGMLVAAGASLVGKMLSSYLRGRASSAHVGAQTDARAQARRAVNEAFDDFQRSLRAEFSRMRTKAIKGTVTATADRAVALRRVARATDGRRYALQQLRDRLPDPDRPSASGWSATEILQAAVRKCEERAGLCGAALWLGEAWVDDPVGLGDAPTRSPRRVRPPVRSVLRTIQRRVSHVIDKVAATPRPGSGRAWLARVERELGGAEGFTDCLKELVRLAADQRPRVVVCGDYDTGKSSFIRRLLIEAGLPVPRTLVIRGDPATSTTAEYEWEGLVLVDTPGFQSGVPTHSGLASAAVADAAGVLYLFNGSLVTGDRQDLAAVLFGDPDRATPPKADRTLFVINRADELCPDPAEDVAGFHRLARRKRVELHAALTAQGGGARPAPKVTSHQIFCVASDPHQVAGPSLAVDVSVFDAERGWDGFDELRGALDDLRTTLSVNAVDVSVLCGGLARLAAWRRELRAEHDRIQWRVHQLDGLGTEIVRRAETGRAIAADRAELLSRLLSDFAVSLVVAAASEAEQSQQRPLAGRVTNLPTDDELTEIVAEWRRATSDEVQAWRSEALDGLSLRIQRRSFTAAFSDEFGAVDTGVFRRAGDRQNRAALAELANLMGKLASHIGTQQTAAATAAGAAARTSSLARLGVVIQGAAMVWDVYELVQGVRQERAREQDQAQLRRSVDEAARNLAAAYVSEDTALNELSELLDALATVHADVLRRAAQEREPITAVSDQISRCADLMADARRLLKTTEGEHDDPT